MNKENIKNLDSNENSVLAMQEVNTNFIEERTQRIFEQLNCCIDENGLIDAAKLACSFGFKIVEHNGLPALLNGMITCDSSGNQMAINANFSKKQKRYSITYLLSTYLLYYQNQEFFNVKHLSSEEDLEASYMARLLLIPESVLNAIYSNTDRNNTQLADIFQVPCNVMEQRVQEINSAKGFLLIKK